MDKRSSRMYIMTVIGILAALIMMVTFNYLSFYNNAVNDLENVGASNLAQEREQIEGYLTKGLDVLQVTAISVEFMMQDGATSEEIENFLVEESKRYMEDIDENFTGIYGLFNDTYIDGIGWVPDEDYDPRTREWYTTAKEAGGKPVLVSPYLDAQTNTIMISVSKLLYDNDSVISLDIVMNEIQEITQAIAFDGFGYGFVVDREGLVVAHNDASQNGNNYFEQDEEMNELLKRAYLTGQDSFQMKINGENCTVFSDSIMDDWYAFMIVSNTKLFQNIRSVLERNITICALITMLIIVFCTFAFRSMKKSAAKEQESLQKLERMNNNIVKALARTIDAKDRYTNGHSQRVANYSVEIAKRMGKSEKECANIYLAALMHDVGKIRVPEEVINKPGKLTEEEFEQIKLHPVTGFHILKDIYEEQQIATGAKYHHERYDGNGYPNGIEGENIPEIARIIGVADSYDAMASNRSYRKALPQEVVRSEIEKGKGTQFDPEIADIMLEMIDEDKDYLMKQTEEKHGNILVVDDENMNLTMIKFLMQDEQMYTIKTATGGEEALRMLDETDISLVLLDVKMPDMDGFDVFKRIREKSDVPIVFMTGDRNLETINRMAEIGADDYITKPVRPLTLKEVIHGILNG